jgi:hypothetical protein
VGVGLDPISVGIEDLDADEAAVILPLGLCDTRRAEALARRVDGGLVSEAEAEVVGAGKVGGDGLGVGEGELGTVGGAEDQQVLVVEDALGEAEVLAVEGPPSGRGRRRSGRRG